jgi:hypothetical protein
VWVIASGENLVSWEDVMKGWTKCWLVFSALVIAQLAPVFTKDAASQGIVFGIKPGLTGVQSSYFGMDVNQLQPYVGLDFARLSFSFEEGTADPGEARNEISGSGLVLVPHLGSRFYFARERQSGDVVPYVQGDFMFSLASVNVDGISQRDKDLAEDILGFWGMSAAFGAEYYFSERFSIGGEYGFRYFNDGVETHRDEFTYDGGWVKREVTDKFDVTFNVSYVTLTLNFHL